MSNNLKVNAKTKPLEFKKKHNLLVEKVEDVEGEIPSSQAITDLAKQAIQADKDILSQIVVEYDEDQGETLYTFPKNVLPITIFDDVSDKVLYFDYIGEFLYKKDGTWLYDGITFSVSGNRLSMSLAGENPIEITAITYVNLNNDLIAEDWYKILNPSGGTKLYKHVIEQYNSGSAIWEEICVLISTSKNAYDLSADFSEIVSDISNNKVISLIDTNTNGTNLYVVNNDTIYHKNMYKSSNTFGTATTYSWSNQCSDTVTEL